MYLPVCPATNVDDNVTNRQPAAFIYNIVESVIGRKLLKKKESQKKRRRRRDDPIYYTHAYVEKEGGTLMTHARRRRYFFFFSSFYSRGISSDTRGQFHHVAEKRETKREERYLAQL